jgi:plastocyanin
MRLFAVLGLVIGGAFTVAVTSMACAEPSIDIVKTQFAVTRATADAATRVAQQTIEAAGGIDLSSLSGQIRATFAAGATATAQAEAAGITKATATPVSKELPPGDPIDGSATVNIGNAGQMDPQVIKITVGTTVTWLNTDRFAHNVATTSPNVPEQFQSGNLAWPLGSQEVTKFEFKFTKPGKYDYGSRWGGDSSNAVIWVVEK